MLKKFLPVLTTFGLVELVVGNTSGFVVEVDSIGARLDSLTFSTGESVKKTQKM